jgi:ATP-dependent RNA helicase DHX33
VIDDLYIILVLPTAPTFQPTINQHQKPSWYINYLKERHFRVNIPVAIKKCLPLPMQKMFNLAIVKKEPLQLGVIEDEFVRMTIRGQMEDILFDKSPIKLENLFMDIEGERKVVLIDGASGSGKTTLTVHICQGWSRGELFQEFSLVILVQLRDPAVQTARSIAELIPSPSSEMAQEIAREIEASLGKDILWVLDGWDHLPSHLQKKSFLKDIVSPSFGSPITRSSIIITSSPSLSGELSELASSRIELLGFTGEQQIQYFIHCLKGNAEAAGILSERLCQNPPIDGSCYLPLNASIVAQLYHSGNSLPTTVKGIFSSFVQHCLSQYLHENPGSQPLEFQAPFDQLCKIAFNGIAQSRFTFYHSDLEGIEDLSIFCEIGLLQATPSILSEGGTMYYTFMHLSIQEILSAVHISRMPASKQISTFDSLFGDPRFSSVFQFYAAITKLRTSIPVLEKLPHWLCPVPTGVLDLVRKIIKDNKSKPLLPSLLHCLYETQDPSLCQYVLEQLGVQLDLSGGMFSSISLNPQDCLAIGYFLSYICLNATGIDNFKVNVYSCTIGDAGTKNLMQDLHRFVGPDSRVNTTLHLNLRINKIHEEGALHIGEILNSTSAISRLELGDNPIGDRGLQPIFDALKQNTSLKYLNIHGCGMTDAGVASLAYGLYANDTLEELHLQSNSAVTDEGMPYLADALSRNSTLVKLEVPHHLGVISARRLINEAKRRNRLPDIEVNRYAYS